MINNLVVIMVFFLTDYWWKGWLFVTWYLGRKFFCFIPRYEEGVRLGYLRLFAFYLCGKMGLCLPLINRRVRRGTRDRQWNHIMILGGFRGRRSRRFHSRFFDGHHRWLPSQNHRVCTHLLRWQYFMVWYHDERCHFNAYRQ
jgi:hypothetical protein